MIRIMLVLTALLVFYTGAHADDSRPLALQIAERQANTYWLQWTLPPTLTADNQPRLVLPAYCQALSSTTESNLYRCKQSLAGETLRLQYPRFTPAFSSVITYQSYQGEQHTALISPDNNQWQVPKAETRSQVAKDYTLLGMRHIWAGNDHLLFLLCLLWIAGSLKRILLTVTGFTLAHSVTLVLSAVDVIRLPVPPVEAVIALSIVFLAREIAEGRSNSLTWRYPLAVSSSFGLIHGLGFAAVLAEIGLPQTAVMTGLLFFNIGVELGQVIFVVGVLAVYRLLILAQGMVSDIDRTPSNTPWSDRLRNLSSYCVGTVAVFWLVERMTVF